MQGNKRLLYAYRLQKDIAELFSHNFDCSSSSLSVIQQHNSGTPCSSNETTENNSELLSLSDRGYITLRIKIFEGPYRGGCFVFALDIPEAYPFRMVDVWAVQPIWHPNIDLFSGRVSIPVDWSPVLTLNSIALGVQMIMLEPSSENPLNIEAYSYYMSNFEEYDVHAQSSLHGGRVISGVKFTRCLMTSEDAVATMICDSDATIDSYVGEVIPDKTCHSNNNNNRGSRKRAIHDDNDEDDYDGEEGRLSRRPSKATDNYLDHHCSTDGRIDPHYKQKSEYQPPCSQQDEFERDIYISYSQLSLHGTGTTDCVRNCSSSSHSGSPVTVDHPIMSSGLRSSETVFIHGDHSINSKRPFQATTMSPISSYLPQHHQVASSSSSHRKDAGVCHHQSHSYNHLTTSTMILSISPSQDASIKRLKTSEENDRRVTVL